MGDGWAERKIEDPSRCLGFTFGHYRDLIWVDSVSGGPTFSSSDRKKDEMKNELGGIFEIAAIMAIVRDYIPCGILLRTDIFPDRPVNLNEVYQMIYGVSCCPECMFYVIVSLESFRNEEGCIFRISSLPFGMFINIIFRLLGLGDGNSINLLCNQREREFGRENAIQLLNPCDSSDPIGFTVQWCQLHGAAKFRESLFSVGTDISSQSISAGLAMRNFEQSVLDETYMPTGSLYDTEHDTDTAITIIGALILGEPKHLPWINSRCNSARFYGCASKPHIFTYSWFASVCGGIIALNATERGYALSNSARPVMLRALDSSGIGLMDAIQAYSSTRAPGATDRYSGSLYMRLWIPIHGSLRKVIRKVGSKRLEIVSSSIAKDGMSAVVKFDGKSHEIRVRVAKGTGYYECDGERIPYPHILAVIVRRFIPSFDSKTVTNAIDGQCFWSTRTNNQNSGQFWDPFTSKEERLLRGDPKHPLRGIITVSPALYSAFRYIRG